jgi:hypothetical protein
MERNKKDEKGKKMKPGSLLKGRKPMIFQSISLRHVLIYLGYK